MDLVNIGKNAISTEFIELDEQWGGLIPGDTYLIGARPAMGKTSFAINMALRIIGNSNHKVAIFHPELVENRMLDKIFAINSKVEEIHIFNGLINGSEMDAIVQPAGIIENGNLILNDIHDNCGLDIDNLDNELDSEVMEGVKVVFIDYLQLCESTALFKSEGREKELHCVCQRIKQIAEKHNVAIVVLSQISRDTESRQNHRPVMKDFAYKEIPGFFDNVAFLYRDEYYDCETEDKGVAEIITVKSKHGKSGTVKLAWLYKDQRFCSLEKNRKGEE